MVSEKALTNLLCRQGIGVIGVSRSEVNEAFSTLQSLQKSVFDLTEYDLPTALSGVIYCPGSINLKPFRSLKINDFNDDFETNALGAVYVLQLAEKALKAGKGRRRALFHHCCRAGHAFSCLCGDGERRH